MGEFDATWLSTAVGREALTALVLAALDAAPLALPSAG